MVSRALVSMLLHFAASCMADVHALREHSLNLKQKEPKYKDPTNRFLKVSQRFFKKTSTTMPNVQKLIKNESSSIAKYYHPGLRNNVTFIEKVLQHHP